MQNINNKQLTITGVVNSQKGCFRGKTKFFWESEDFVDNREAKEIFPEAQSNKVSILGRLRFFWKCLPKNQDDIPVFQGGGGLLYTDGSAHTAFVRAVIPPYNTSI